MLFLYDHNASYQLSSRFNNYTLFIYILVILSVRHKSKTKNFKENTYIHHLNFKIQYQLPIIKSTTYIRHLIYKISFISFQQSLS